MLMFKIQVIERSELRRRGEGRIGKLCPQTTILDPALPEVIRKDNRNWNTIIGAVAL
jgi:hypothetical protein